MAENTKHEREKILDRLKKLYQHQKSAKSIGSEAEAQAFAERIQQLLSIHKIEMSAIEEQKLDEVDPVRQKKVDFESAGIPLVRRRLAWQEHLASIVGHAYFCEILVVPGFSTIFFVGRGTDVEAAEQVFLYLVRVASSLADQEYVKYFYECKAQGDVTRARGFRSSYLVGFTSRLSQRYREEKKRMKAEYAANMTALVRLTNAMVPVEAYLKKMREEKNSRMAPQLGGRSMENAEGVLRGKEAADKVPIGQNTKQINKD